VHADDELAIDGADTEAPVEGAADSLKARDGTAPIADGFFEPGGPEEGVLVEEFIFNGEFDDPITRERDEYLDALRRLQAEFDNYRKRMTRQQFESIERATESLLNRLLPVLDALDLALAHSAEVPEESSTDRQALIQIASLLRDILSKEGLERIDATGVAFDPNIHDAVTHLEPDEGTDEDGVVVTDVLRAGYQLKGKIVRPAMVQVRG
jgi:molecular chaperone GrpE